MMSKLREISVNLDLLEATTERIQMRVAKQGHIQRKKFWFFYYYLIIIKFYGFYYLI